MDSIEAKIMLLAIENKRLVDQINRKTEIIKVLLTLVEDTYPGLTELMTTDEALRRAAYYKPEDLNG